MQNSSAVVIEEADTRAIVNMMAEVSALEDEHTIRKRRLLELLSDYIGADKWLAALRVQNTVEEAPFFVGQLFAGFEPEQLVKLAESAAHPSVKEIEAPLGMELMRRKTQLTLRLEDFDQKQLWASSPAGELAEQAGVGTFLASTRPFFDPEDGSLKASAIALYRSPGQPKFSERELRIAHIVLTEVSWLHTEGWPSEFLVKATADLPRSHLPMLTLLVQGNSRQEIAQLTERSINTVNSYAKTIFNHFNVKSQTELMKHFIYGDGNDRMAN